MSSNPYAPPGWGPSPLGGPPPMGAPRRRGWPTGLLVTVSLVTGLLLMTLPLIGVGAVARDGGPRDISTSSSPGPSTSEESPAPTPRGGGDSPPLRAPDGATVRFTVPADMEVDKDDKDKDPGHAAFRTVDDGEPYLDVYVDQTAASRRKDLRAAATAERAFAPRNGGTASAVTYTKYADQPLAQFQVHYPAADGDPAIDALVTVLVVHQDLVAIYWADRKVDFGQLSANADELLVVRSLEVDGGVEPTT